MIHVDKGTYILSERNGKQLETEDVQNKMKRTK